ncbi:hypothetical protein ACS0TY_022892 [Phlomoides rotata]
MDRYSGKRGATGSIAPRKAYKVGAKDATTSKDENVQYCNRIGCQGRIKYMNQNANKGKCSRPSSCSSSGNEIIRNSSRSGSVMTKAKSLNLDSKRKLASQSEFEPAEGSQSGDSSSHHSGSPNTSREAKIGTSSMPTSTTPRKMLHLQHKPGSNVQKTQAASVSKSSGLGTTNSSNKSRCLKNLKCNSITNVVPSSGSKSAVKNVMKKRSPEAESSLSRRGKNTSATSSTDKHTFVSRRSSWTTGEDSSGATSVRTRRSTYLNQNRTGLSSRQNGRNTLFGREPSFRPSSQFPCSGLPTSVGSSSLMQQSANGSSSGWSSSSLSISNDENHSPSASADRGFGHLMNRDALQRYSMDSMSEVLLELERIEQDEEITHEVLKCSLLFTQILALEASLYLSNRSIYDQHRDMRLDIDNMSYEELLALGERMGTVSTALSEDALSKCLRRSVYQVTPSEERSAGSGNDGDDVNCSICQEEYEMGDEVGKLVECQHVYHTVCINQWLQLKNWCPICKTTAAPQEESS